MAADEVKIDPAVVAAMYFHHAEELRYFLLGLLRNAETASEVLQATFTKAVEVGHKVQEGSLKAWLFRVAYNEAMALRRRQATGEKVVRRMAWNVPEGEATPEARVSRWETVVAVRRALEALPDEQRQVVKLRIYEQKKFAEIAEELQLPLGTVLSRMQLAIKKMRRTLDTHRDQE